MSNDWHISDLSSISSSDDIDEEIRELLRFAREFISQNEIPTVTTQSLVAANQNRLTYSTYDQTSIGQLISGSKKEISKSKETNEFVEKVKEIYGFEIGINYITRILSRAFQAKDNGRIRTVDSVYDIKNRVVLDSLGKSKTETTMLISGVIPSESLKLSNQIWIHPLDKIDAIQLNRVHDAGSAQPGRIKYLHCTAVIRYISQRKPYYELDDIAITGTENKILQALKLYGPSDAQSIMSISHPITYWGVRRISESRSLGGLTRCHINATDARRVSNVYDLISKYYDDDDLRFKSPFELPLGHFNTAVERKNSFQSSISFAIIGLESLFKQCTAGSRQSSKEISLYVALLLGLSSNRFHPPTVLREVGHAYNARNTWVHGDDSSNQASIDTQKEIWDYLRASIVVFCHLASRGKINMNSKINLEMPLVDKYARMWLEQESSVMRLHDYLKLDRPISTPQNSN